MENPANIAPIEVREALDRVIEHIEAGFEMAVSEEGVLGGEGQSWAEFARDYTKGEGGARDMQLLALLDELRDDWTDGVRTKHTLATREQEYPTTS